MCGITGVFAFTEEGKQAFENIQASVDVLKQRGPDNQSTLVLENVAFGHSRLSIIDLSDAASQPMSDITKRYSIIFNGEIFNFKELRKNLITKGLPLKTQSDTEVILYSYIIEGPRFVKKLNGFFAFAIYDNKENSLFIARDRMGIKPLVFYRDRNKLLFASEMKALIKLGIPKRIDQTSLCEYFQFNYIPSPHSIFEHVQKLAPGHSLFIENGLVKEEEFYTIPYNRSNLSSATYADSQVKLQQLIEESVKARLVADVPLGAFLSGGIDSSVIVAEASKHTEHLNTFSIGFKDEPFFDETHYAKLVANKFQTNHHAFELTTNDLYEGLHHVLNYIDEPFADSSALPVNILSMHTHKHVTVALSGDGADELFSGYNKHKAHFNAIYGGFYSSLVKMGAPIWKLSPKSRNSKSSNMFRQLEKYATGMKLTERERYWQWASLMSQDDAIQLLKKPVLLNHLKVRKNEIIKHILPSETINDILLTDMKLVLVSDMLFKVDHMSMSNSLEVRTPFLDHNVVNYIFSLPEEYKINSKMRKRILQDTYKNILPKELYQRPKQGFEVPLLRWFQTDLKDEIINKYLNDDFIEYQGIFNPNVIKQYKEKLFSNNPGDIQAHIWALIVFQNWWAKYFS